MPRDRPLSTEDQSVPEGRFRAAQEQLTGIGSTLTLRTKGYTPEYPM